MTEKPIEFQPGAILHDAVVGTFRAHGGSFERWCKENGVTPSVARNATFGQSRGPAGQAMLARIIEAAGRDFVLAAYRKRIVEHGRKLAKGGA